MRQDGELVSINVSPERGTAKVPVPQAVLDDRGLVGDGHADTWHRQVSVLDDEAIRRFATETGLELAPGAFGENLTLRGIDLAEVRVLDQLCVGEALLEVTQIGKTCHGDTCAIFRRVGRCIMPDRGLFCRVRRGGLIRAGEPVVHEARPLRVLIITLSDRAAQGVYPDRSGPAAEALLRRHLEAGRMAAVVERRILPDEPEQLRGALASARQGGTDIVISTGSTGAGPRDIAPEVVVDFCDKVIPGIMEAIRLKHAATNPRALLSRSVAGVAGTMLVYAIPGSPRAVEEYLAEIALTLGHLLFMVRGIDVHEHRRPDP